MATEITRRKLIPAISADTLTIISALKALDSPEKIVTKAELQAAIGRDPMGLMHTAIRHMLREHNVVVRWVRERGGWCRREGAENLLDRKGGLTSLRRKSRRESERLSVIDFGKLSDPQKLEACSVTSLFGAVNHMATSNAIKRIGGAIQKADAAGLALGKTLALFLDNEKA